jgi:hypothetical protein
VTVSSTGMVSVRSESGPRRPLSGSPLRLVAISLAVAGSLLLVITWLFGGGRGSDESTPSSFFGQDFNVREGGDFGLENLEVRMDSEFGEVLRVRYPEGSASPTVSEEEGAPVGGAQLYLEPRSGVPADRLHLRYYVRFPKEFDYVKGGKLPGLYGGTVTGGRRSPDGTDGFSTRFMWRRNGAGEVYAYLATSEEEGTSLGRGSWRFESGEWQLIEQEVSLNEPGRPDGRIRVWLDGREVLNETNLLFRTVDTLKIEGLFFSTFFGGSDLSWATPKKTAVDFAGFKVGSDYLGPIFER